MALVLAAGLVPVLLFLAGLLVMDSYQLVPRRAVFEALAAGCLAAGVAWLGNRLVLDHLHLDSVVLRRYVAPVLEETCKAAFVAWRLRRDRVGFMVDAGILGFASGAGFALVENLYYATAAPGLGAASWLVRGLGTAVMHGSTTAMFAITSKVLCDFRPRPAFRLMLPGLGLAIVVHSAFNHLVLSPLVMTALLLVAMPLLLLLVFDRSERATRNWLGTGFDGDLEALEQVLDGEIEGTRVGDYLESLRARFPGAVVADMLCLLRIHLELSLRAKGMLIARAAGIEIEPDESVRANLEEMRYLERAIGPTGRLAILPLRRTHSRDLWQILLLERRSAREASRPA
jgi:RsiW-degrading membrane proteinase PrsW (M82 family)